VFTVHLITYSKPVSMFVRSKLI